MENLHIDKLIEEIENLKEAADLLEKVWLEIGPYTDKISDELSYKLNSFFKFDDSE